ncbi:uncharacterized protein K460DRAFT_365447 [Cucurbitaria berberidis CBS 394.84]|uniref:Uncharacterized protein n=1 Tax=Cucurbitaria berberidis CBS 394.84 TaxID=1168544 RepID=A0A9P4GF93_9PLEO|nr:uncharacterized protein K460DRAFT_365447 [Cucurbitaria berberidis CBS 394.84]KAF1844485.1 hypothetical protein K460DRAFT_365447 [Cucurbitaria berberidis CBS 394.84]
MKSRSRMQPKVARIPPEKSLQQMRVRPSASKPPVKTRKRQGKGTSESSTPVAQAFLNLSTSVNSSVPHVNTLPVPSTAHPPAPSNVVVPLPAPPRAFSPIPSQFQEQSIFPAAKQTETKPDTQTEPRLQNGPSGPYYVDRAGVKHDVGAIEGDFYQERFCTSEGQEISFDREGRAVDTSTDELYLG